MASTPSSCTLLLIDLQNDFHPGGSLAIPNASADALQTSSFLRANAGKIQQVVATLDTHEKYHIAHAAFWESGHSDGDTPKRQPQPFTVISAQSVESGEWRPRSDLVLPQQPQLPSEAFPDLQSYCRHYTRTLEQQPNKFQLTIWPEHCLIGSFGHNIVPPIREALDQWSGASGRNAHWVLKGRNPLTEMYSCLRAEVPVCEETNFNHELMELLKASQTLIVCGQALSHCVNYTLRDILQHWPIEEYSRIILLEDCCSSVPGFETVGEEFLKEMRGMGIRVEKSVDVTF